MSERQGGGGIAMPRPGMKLEDSVQGRGGAGGILQMFPKEELTEGSWPVSKAVCREGGEGCP